MGILFIYLKNSNTDCSLYAVLKYNSVQTLKLMFSFNLDFQLPAC